MVEIRTVHVSWNDVEKLIRQISQEVINDSFKPDVVIGIQRGGLIPAVHLSHLLNVREFRSIGIKTMQNDEMRANRLEPIIEYETPLDIVFSKRVLLVDDVVNTGSTLSLASKIVREAGASTIRTVAIFLDVVNILEPPQVDYIGKIIDAWPLLPWEG